MSRKLILRVDKREFKNKVNPLHHIMPGWLGVFRADSQKKKPRLNLNIRLDLEGYIDWVWIISYHFLDHFHKCELLFSTIPHIYSYDKLTSLNALRIHPRAISIHHRSYDHITSGYRLTYYSWRGDIVYLLSRKE